MANEMNTATTATDLQTNNSAVMSNNEPSDNDDNSIIDAISAELAGNDDTAVVQDKDEDDADAKNDDNSDDADADKKKDDKTEDDITEDDNSEVEIPEKFKTKDGTLNLKALSKFIKDSETYNTQLSQEKAELIKKQDELKAKAELAENLEKQQDELAKKFGFENFSAMQQKQQEVQANTQLAQYQANCYAEYLSLCESPQDVRDLLIKYSQNPTQELAKMIGDEFPPEVHIQVGEKIAGFKNQLAQYQAQQERIANTKKAEEHINNVVNQYGDWFKNKEFANVYALAFHYLGIDLDPQKMFPAMQALKDSWIKEYQASVQAKQENDSAVQNLQQLSPSNSSNSKPKSNNINVDINNIKPDELDKLVGQLV